MSKSLRVAILLLIAGISGLAGWQALQVQFDYDFERLFPQDHPQTHAYLSFREDFGYDVNYLLVGLENEAGIFDSVFLYRVASLTDALATLPNVQAIQGPTTLSYLVREPLFGNFSSVPYLSVYQPDSYAQDSAVIFANQDRSAAFFSPKSPSVSLLIQQQPGLSEAECTTLMAGVDSLLQARSFEVVHIAGRCSGQIYYTALMKREVLVFISASVTLIALFLALLFRSWVGVSVPLVIVGLSVLWTVALLHLSGRPLDVMSNVIPSIILVVGISAVVHILAHYREQLKTLVPEQALKKALKQVGTANLMTALTTALGFLTLLTAGVDPIEAFGLFATLGVLIAFGLTYVLLPTLLPWLPTPAPHRTSSQQLEKWIHQALQGIIRWRKAILWATAGLTLLSLLGLSQLKINNFLLEDLRADNPLQQDFLFFETEFAGARSFEMLLTRPDSLHWQQRETWIPVDSLSAYLGDTYDIGNQLSPLTFLKTLNQAYEVGKASGYRLPETQRRMDQVWRSLRRGERQANLAAYLQGNRIRISGLMPDLGSQEIARRDSALAEWFAVHMPEGYGYELTGLPTLLDQTNQLVARNVLGGLAFALLLTALLLGGVFRSVRIVWIALIPNLLPLLWIGGIMGLLGIDLKLSTSLIFAISFGIAVDDTIHFMNRLRWELRAGSSLMYAVKRSFLSTGRAILLTTLILAGGFWVLTLSEFLGTFYIGLLVSLTLIFALLADLVLLPILLWYFGEKGQSAYERPPTQAYGNALD